MGPMYEHNPEGGRDYHLLMAEQLVEERRGMELKPENRIALAHVHAQLAAVYQARCTQWRRNA